MPRRCSVVSVSRSLLRFVTWFLFIRRGPPRTRKKGKLLALKIKPFSLYNLYVSFPRFDTFGERLPFSKKFLLHTCVEPWVGCTTPHGQHVIWMMFVVYDEEQIEANLTTLRHHSMTMSCSGTTGHVNSNDNSNNSNGGRSGAVSV